MSQSGSQTGIFVTDTKGSLKDNNLIGKVLLVLTLIFILIVLYFERGNIQKYNANIGAKLKSNFDEAVSVKVYDTDVNNIKTSAKKYFTNNAIVEKLPVKPEETIVTTQPETILENTQIEYVFPSNFIYDDSVSNSFVSNVYNYYLCVPENVRMHFEQCGGKVQIVNNLGYLGYSEQVLETNECTIWIDNREKAKDAVIHELGHFVEYYCGSVHDTPEFYNIWASEVNTFKGIDNTDDANTNTPKEYFAESFYYVIMHPDIMSQNCPQTYNFIMMCINAI